MFRPCVLIPVYNHPQKIAATVANIVAMDLPLVLIDDGSEPVCARLLADLAGQFTGVTLLTLNPNQGKGAAVVKGLRWAFQAGYSHGLQIDADGQHALADIPQFCALARAFPEAIISGERIYGQAPRSRRIARKLTDVWVYINTLSLEIRDSMCGFRLYPLVATESLLAAQTVGQRMDFDTDILVKLFWRGWRVLHVPTQVTYAADIPSHFALVQDNLRISWMHTRLFFGMVARLPVLLPLTLKRRPLSPVSETLL